MSRASIAGPVRIRLCEAADLRALEWDGLFTDHRATIEEAFARQQAGRNVMFVAQAGERLVGQVWLDLDKGGRLWALRTHPSARRRGIGSALMRTAERWLAARGFPRAALGVEKTNASALRLYRRSGYDVVAPMLEHHTYTTPSGEFRRVAVDQWLLEKPLPRRAPLGVRWTVGAVSDGGFEALRLSILGACRLFGPDAAYAVYVNTCAVDEARRRTGPVPPGVEWRLARRGDMPRFLARHFDAELAEGVGWKFMPLRAFEDRHELALDNDCILWDVPPAIERWLTTDREACVLAEDVRACFGQFVDDCGGAPRNSGIRGVPSGFDFAAALRGLLARRPVVMQSETDEQGLQVAALRARPSLTVSTEAVTICSPFYTHQPHLGRCGAHFVGLNAHQMPWDYYGRPAVDCLREHWARMRPNVAARIGAG